MDLIVPRSLIPFPFVLQSLAIGQLASSLLIHLACLLLSSPAQLLFLLAPLEFHLLPVIKYRRRCRRDYLLPVLARNLVHPMHEPNIARLIHVPELLRRGGCTTQRCQHQRCEENLVCSSRAHTPLCVLRDRM
jgi:hypothetical protein